MNLLQTLPRFSDEVTVSSLPHPISMFMLGTVTVIVIVLFIEYKRTRTDLKEYRQTIKELEKELENTRTRVEEKLREVSKKVDSRVDKAILALKKSTEGNK